MTCLYLRGHLETVKLLVGDEEKERFGELLEKTMVITQKNGSSKEETPVHLAAVGGHTE